MTTATPQPQHCLRIGVVGGGTMAHTHLAAWQRLGVRALAFSPSGRGAAIAGGYGARGVRSENELIAGCDVVDICTPTGTHRQIAERALAAGRHVICEKPLALTHDDALAIVAAAKEHGLALHVAHVVRYFAAYVAARERIAHGDLGVVAELRLRRTGAAQTAAWFHDDAASGGVLMDQMIHDFDFARWTLGEVESVSASSETAIDRAGRPIVRATATLTHVGGALSHLTGGWLGPDAPFTTSIEAIGDDGELRHTNTAGALTVTRHGSTARVELGSDLPYDDELIDFAAAIATGSTPRATPADAVAAVDLTLAARRSAATGLPVTLRP